jgi:Zn-dependent protease
MSDRREVGPRSRAIVGREQRHIAPGAQSFALQAGVAMARGRRVDHITLYGLVAAVRRSADPGRPRDQLLIAMAGPACHLLLACALGAAWHLLPVDNEPLRVAAAFPALSNLAAGVLNLMPVHPLDGGRAARALLAVIVRV